MIDHDAAVRAYLNFLMKTLKLSASALAQKAGISSTTLTRFLNSPSHKFSISMTTIDKLARSTDVSFSPFLDGGAGREIRSIWSDFHKPEDQKEGIIEVRIEAGIWSEVSLFDRVLPGSFHLLPPTDLEQDTFYAAIRGNSVNKIADDGEYLYCYRESKFLREVGPIRNGNLLVAAHHSVDKTLQEFLCLQIFQDQAKTVLVYPSTSNHYSNLRYEVTYPLRADSPFKVLGVAVCRVQAFTTMFFGRNAPPALEGS